MSESSINGSDAIADFTAALGFTRKLAATQVASQTSDADGALEPGRYLVQLINPSAADAIAWLRAVPFVKTETVAVDQDAPSFPLQRNALVSVQFNALRGVSDRVAVRMSAAATGTLYITRISRDA